MRRLLKWGFVAFLFWLFFVAKFDRRPSDEDDWAIAA